MFKWKIALSYALLLLIFSSDDAFCNSLGEQLAKANALHGMVVGPRSVPVNKPILRTFFSDGCSLSPNSFFKVNFAQCCVEHDLAYWIGGTKEQKDLADNQFKMCLQHKLNKDYNGVIQTSVSETYFLGVQIGGVNFLPNSFRWGYGWNVIRPHGPLTDEEVGQAENMYGKDLVILKKQIASGKYAFNWQLYTLDNTLFTFLPADKIVYNYLKWKLKRSDVVLLGSQALLDANTQMYTLKLKSCNTFPIKIKMNYKKLLLALKTPVDYENAQVLSDFILDIEDKSACLRTL